MVLGAKKFEMVDIWFDNYPRQNELYGSLQTWRAD